MIAVPVAYRTLMGSTRRAAAMSWPRSDALSRSSAWSTTPRASTGSTTGQAVRASIGAT
jgi:hypothetical protein